MPFAKPVNVVLMEIFYKNYILILIYVRIVEELALSSSLIYIRIGGVRIDWIFVNV